VIASHSCCAPCFVPCAFLSASPVSSSAVRGHDRRLHRHSAFNSLTLSPALAAILLKPHSAPRDPLTWLLDLVLAVLRPIQLTFAKGTAGYGWSWADCSAAASLVMLATPACWC